MSLEFLLSKNNKQIAVWNGQYIHSTYDPEREAKRFVENLEIKKGTKFLVFIAPFAGFTHDFFKEKYPDISIICIEFFQNKALEHISWDYLFEINSPSLSQKLYQIIGEENILFTQVISWPTSEILFNDKVKKVVKILQVFFSMSRDVLGTRMFFSQKWIKNCFRNISLVKNYIALNPIEKPLCIIASGPSLAENIDFLKQIKNDCLLLALSSSLSFLVSQDIIPDYCLTTDGGFWAKMHLAEFSFACKNTIFIASLESALPYKILENNKIHFIDYGDGLSHYILQNLKIKSQKALRSGTVSGTALSLAENLSRENIFFLGLDLAVSKGFSHSQPNALELQNNYTDNRFMTKTNRISMGNFQSQGSLKIYENWFKSFKAKEQKVYRIKAKNFPFHTSFIGVDDIDAQDAMKKIFKNTFTQKIGKSNRDVIDLKNLKKSISELLQMIKELEFNEKEKKYEKIAWLLKEICLKEYLSFKQNENEESFFAMQTESISFLEKCIKYLE